ncbi:hypothetical protein ACE38V_03210 [Cytobacillus sp. Hz8]|uniref:hypothetical protein n=1 Tax=Cytobacillus sp. Hz8 TaxID=3347168 RepID=UPI0035DC6496
MGMDMYVKNIVDFPLVKQELITQIGIWVDGKAFWLKSVNEKILIEQGISLQIKKDHFHSKIYYYGIYLTNHMSKDRDVQILFMHQHKEATKDHFSFISPSENVIYHLANNKVYLVNGEIGGRVEGQRTVQPYWNFYNDLCWRNLDKGILQYRPMVKGAAVSLMSIGAKIPPKKTIKGSSWVIMDERKLELERLNKLFIKKTD